MFRTSIPPRAQQCDSLTHRRFLTSWRGVALAGSCCIITGNVPFPCLSKRVLFELFQSKQPSSNRRVILMFTGTAAAIGFLQYDTHFCYSRFNRNMRSLVAFVETIIDYKLRSVAPRIHNCSNMGFVTSRTWLLPSMPWHFLISRKGISIKSLYARPSHQFS